MFCLFFCDLIKFIHSPFWQRKFDYNLNCKFNPNSNATLCLIHIMIVHTLQCLFCSLNGWCKSLDFFGID